MQRWQFVIWMMIGGDGVDGMMTFLDGAVMCRSYVMMFVLVHPGVKMTECPGENVPRISILEDNCHLYGKCMHVRRIWQCEA